LTVPREVAHQVADLHRGGVGGSQARKDAQHVALDGDGAVVDATPGVQRHRRGIAHDAHVGRGVGSHGRLAQVEAGAGRIDGGLLFGSEADHVGCPLRSADQGLA